MCSTDTELGNLPVNTEKTFFPSLCSDHSLNSAKFYSFKKNLKDHNVFL